MVASTGCVGRASTLEACLAALLGDESNGRWRIAPRDEARITRRYRDETAILETRFETGDGVVTLIDFMPLHSADTSEIIRIVVGEKGLVAMEMGLNLRFDYGRLTPWATKRDNASIDFLCGPHSAGLTANVDTNSEDGRCSAAFKMAQGERKAFVLQYRRSHFLCRQAPDPERSLKETERAWRDWTAICPYKGPYRDAVLRSLITIKTMTSSETGGIIAAPTTSLPEKIGGNRNFDYRFCWLRDATFTLLALLHSGYSQEAGKWRDWLLRAVAGMPTKVQPLYGVAGEHRLPEWKIGWLCGFRDSKPVRAGNAAYSQLQIDIYGEVLDALHQSRTQAIPPEDWSWRLQKELVNSVARVWQEPDAGIWELRHAREHFTHSRVMAWVALDRAVKAAETYQLDWPLERWRDLRTLIHRDVCENGYDEDLGGFVRSYETREPDSANLLIPIVGFLPANDSRVLKTLELIERKLMRDGFVMRYDTAKSEDGFPEGEGVFLACSFWYVDNLVMQGREKEARDMFERLLKIRNDVGLLSEEYDPYTKQLLGNFPQGLSHLTLINSAHNLTQDHGPARARAGVEPR